MLAACRPRRHGVPTTAWPKGGHIDKSYDSRGSDNRLGWTNGSDRPRLTQATVVGPPGETTVGICRWRIVAPSEKNLEFLLTSRCTRHAHAALIHHWAARRDTSGNLVQLANYHGAKQQTPLMQPARSISCRTTWRSRTGAASYNIVYLTLPRKP